MSRQKIKVCAMFKVNHSVFALAKP